MPSAHEIARRHLEAALSEGAEHSLAPDTVARAFLTAAVEVFRRDRPVDDIRSELEFLAENLEEDDGYFPFMRP